MSDVVDPFDDDEIDEIVNDALAGQLADAIAGAQGELDDVTVAIDKLTARLGENVPAPAVVSLVMSLALGATIRGTYG